ncbi:CapA family protein [Butyrivibrio sp. YAB3001]|uniref:CapA family protein n=1 Tax=Butyrivibrio sp. YAB3001 TaxID=1520812 RepID=UPI0008F62CCD|nr:CapA family protein [Butyrivibrio sp. YAB3001]SFC84552.1 capsule synthesis protein PGA_cap [Butyrivibrio sp. YAB3001]
MIKIQKVSIFNKNIRWLLLFLGIVVAICIGKIFIKNNSIPGWVKWNDKEITFQNNAFTIKLFEKKIIVFDTQKNEVFKTENKLKVQDVILSDIDRDGKEEIIALVWKKGKFGKHRPFWIEKDEEKYSQHLFIYRESNDEKTIVPMWFASDTGLRIKRIKPFEKNNSIIMVEDIDDETTLWAWDSWGLKKIDNTVEIVAFGDNIIHEAIYRYAANEKNGSFDFLYEPFKEEIKNADIAAVNCETVLVDNKNSVSGYPIFGSPVEVGEALINAGFNVISCANNHVLDKGKNGIDLTKTFFDNHGITCIGIQNSNDTEYRPYEIMRKNGISISMFSFTYGTNQGDTSKKYPNMIHYLPRTENEEEKLLQDLREAKKESDIIMIFVHWGDEYKEEITDYQKHFADLFAKGGADIVIGSHPHVVQKVETLERENGGKTIVYYSLGNFRANQGQSDSTKKGAEAKITLSYTFDGARITDNELIEINSYWK